MHVHTSCIFMCIVRWAFPPFEVTVRSWWLHWNGPAKKLSWCSVIRFSTWASIACRLFRYNKNTSKHYSEHSLTAVETAQNYREKQGIITSTEKKVNKVNKVNNCWAAKSHVAGSVDLKKIFSFKKLGEIIELLHIAFPIWNVLWQFRWIRLVTCSRWSNIFPLNGFDPFPAVSFRDCSCLPCEVFLV